MSLDQCYKHKESSPLMTASCPNSSINLFTVIYWKQNTQAIKNQYTKMVQENQYTWPPRVTSIKSRSALQRSRRCEVSFSLLICHPTFHECCSTVIEESSTQIFCDITGLQPRRPVRRHLIGVEWVKTPTHEETREGVFRTFMSRVKDWLLGITTRGDISSSASLSPVEVTI